MAHDVYVKLLNLELLVAFTVKFPTNPCSHDELKACATAVVLPMLRALGDNDGGLLAAVRRRRYALG